MPRKKSYPTFTDQFCGAGGSSQGASKAGAEGIMAMNHWKLAIDTHSTNFPKMDHDCSDISASDPRRYPSTDILITSPECTNHSLAKGKKVAKKQMDLYASGELDPAAERSRATMWDVCRFAEYHDYNCIIVENVVDARKWVMFDSWIMAMRSMNYLHKCVYMNSMHAHPTPQSRDRMYVVFWKKGNKAPDLEFTPSAWCSKCEKNTNAIQSWKKNQKTYKYKTGYLYCCPHCSTVVEPYYYAAFNCVDWSDLGTKIGERRKELSPKTITRIQYGLNKYANHNPLIINDQHTSGVECRVRSVCEKMDTITTTPRIKLVVPFIIKFEHKKPIATVDKPLHTQTTRQSMALITVSHGTGKTKNITDPLNAVTAGGIKSGIITDGSWNSFISSYYGGSNCTKHITEETGTITTGDRLSITSYKKPNIEDCYYRMLKHHEVQLAMAFDKEYVVLGNSRDKVKQLGNAVTPPAMEWLMARVMASLN